MPNAAAMQRMLSRTQRNSQRSFSIKAPVGGINTIAVGTEMPPTDSILSYNLIGAEYGLRPRLGWAEYVTGLDGDPRSMLSFMGSPKSGANNRLFAVTQSGIWNCSASTNAPTRVVTFGTQNADSGYGTSCAFTDLNGNHWLAYCDEANGYFTYSEQGATWTQIGYGNGAGLIQETQGQGYPTLNPALLCFVMAFKNRLWFVERDSQRAWYLPFYQITGGGATGAAPFYFGPQFKAGGDLRGLYDWTYDGGAGINDLLVAVSGGGDVVIYGGTDPATASSFAIQGIWNIGAVPAGRRICTNWGGDVLAMSATGIMPLSKLVIGNVVYDRSQYSTYKISNLFNQLQANTASMRGWAMRLHPLDAALIVTVPTAVNQPTQQLAMSLSTRGWHQYRNMPMGIDACAWNGSFYFASGDGNGRVLINQGYLDGLTLAAPQAYTPIQWSTLTAFSNLGSGAMKQVQTIATRIMSQGGAVSVFAKANYGLDLSEAPQPTGAVLSAGSTWDSALWDAGTWAGQYTPQRNVFGAFGMAPEVAIAVAGSSTARMSLVGIDVGFLTGAAL